MKTVRTLATLALLAYGTAAVALDSTSQMIRRDAPQGTTTAFFTCIDKADSDAIARGACVSAEKSKQDSRLNTTFEKLLGKLDPKAKEALVVSEREWLKLQDATDRLENSLYGDEGIAGLQLPPPPTLADPVHPGNGMFSQTLDAVYRLDSQYGRTPDLKSENLAGALAVTAQCKGLNGVDHAVLSDDAIRAFAIQGDLNSPFKRYADVDVTQAIGTPLAQSSVQWQQNAQQAGAAQTTSPLEQTQNPRPTQPTMQR